MRGKPICILREPEGLVALVLPDAKEASEPLRVPLQALSDRAVPGGSALLASWEALGRARGATAETLTHVLRVLASTVPGDDVPTRAVPHPWPEPPPAPHRRTAAHPRGYRGTTHQPPKRSQPEVIDLRPHLLQRRTVRALLDALRDHAAEATRGLEARGDAGVRWARVLQALDEAMRADVGLAWRHGFLDTRGAELPAAFVRLGCLLAEGTEEDFRRFLALRGRLALDTHVPVLMAAARVLCVWGTRVGLPWLEVAARLVPDAQVELLAALCEVDVSHVDASSYDVAIEPLLASRPMWRRLYLWGLEVGLPSDYLHTGYRLMDAHGVTGSPPTPSAGGLVPEETLTTLFAHIHRETSAGFFLPTLWALCGELPRFSEALESIPWTRLSPGAAFRLMATLCELRDDSSVTRRVRLRRWSRVRRLLPSWLALLARTPASHQERCVATVRAVMAWAAPPWEGPAFVEAATLALAERVCRPPYDVEDCLSFALGGLSTHPSPEVRQRLLEVPERSLLLFDAGCKPGSGHVAMIRDGMALLAKHDVTWVFESLEGFPEVLMRTVRLLGSLWNRQALEVLADFSRHPLEQERPWLLPQEQMVAVLGEHCSNGVESPLPRKARKTLEEGGTLSPTQLARARRIVKDAWPRVRLQVLARLVLARLRGPWDADVDDARVRHALQMASLVRENRRALRRLLTRYFAGERDFIPKHPASRAWFARHPRVNPETWLTGLTLRREVSGLGEVTLALEQDSLEALRLGTHVGSCLALNGICDSSAAAMVLDVNRRVLYARDAKGRVVGRQLLSISVKDTLVPNFVYPRSVSPELEAFFLDYDLAFAEALGLPLSEGPDAPAVEHVLSQSFWEDGAWELGGPGEA